MELRQDPSSAQIPQDGRPAGGEERSGSGRRRRRGRQGRRLRNRAMALGFGFVLFGVAAGLLALIVGEVGDSDEELAIAGPSNARARPASLNVPVVTCPGTDKGTQHPAFAAACGDRAALKGLLARSGAGNAGDPRQEFAGRTALHHAAQRGDTDMVGQLLAAGADPNQPDADGHTPLHLVAATRQLRHPEFVARRLIDGGARIDLRNTRGLTPIEELETDHQRLLDQQNLAKVLFQKEREGLSSEPPAGATEGEAKADAPTEVEIDTKLGRVRIPVEPPAAGEIAKTP